jgi:hypothetical protein
VTAISDLDAEQKKLRLGVDIMVSTPGRILSLLVLKASDHIKNSCLIRIIVDHGLFCIGKERDIFRASAELYSRRGRCFDDG